MTTTEAPAGIAARFKLHEHRGMVFLIAAMTPITIFLIVQAIKAPSVFFRTFMQSMALGSMYALIALGFVLIFKASEVVNFSQGALAMVGALFLSFAIADGHIPLTTIRNPLADINPYWLAWFLSLAVALAFAALLGLVIERIAIRPMIGKPIFSVAVITLGLEIVLRVAATDSVKTQFRSLGIPWSNQSFVFRDTRIEWSYIAVIAFAFVAFVAVFFFYRSRTGVAMRAVARDQEAAMAQGINVGRVFAIAWGSGAVLAALGGIFSTQPPVKQTGAVEPDTALIAFRALPAVILGGLDSVQGALIGGLLIGAAEIYAGQYLAGQTSWLGAGYPAIIPYFVMIIVLIVRPYGIFGQAEVRRV